jgi:toxin ParE1/3/4
MYGAGIWGEERAQLYAEEIDAAIARLAVFPEAGTPCRHKGLTFRRWRVGSHAILYRTTSAAVLIARILHVRMLVGRHLS